MPSVYKELDNYKKNYYSKELATLGKIYGSEYKYSGYNDNFDYKFKVFLDLC